MKEYSAFEASDFVLDEHFIRWVKGNDPELESFWVKFLEQHPEKTDEVDEARRMILAVINEQQHFPSDNQQQLIWNRVLMGTMSQSSDSLLSRSWFRVAAILAFVFAVSYGVYYTSNEPSHDVALVEEQVIPESALSERVNNSEKPLTMLLSDGSSIVLQPKSALRYPQSFSGENREVHLQGEAFFKIAKDPKRPFLVYANELVTRVLGTSFTVRAYDNEPEVIVEVQSGKVSVFSQESRDKNVDTANPRREGLVLTPNQQAVYTRSEAKLVKSLFENPTLLVDPEASEDFEFVDARMKDVFEQLEQSYGVSIVYDEEVMSNCFLNASLSDESLSTKLTLICKAVNASYEIMDTHIIVYGKGCDE